MKASFLDPAVFSQVKRDLRMTFDARNRIDDDAALLHDVSLESRTTVRNPQLELRSETSDRANVRLPPFQQFGHDVINRVGRRRTARHEHIDIDEFVHRP